MWNSKSPFASNAVTRVAALLVVLSNHACVDPPKRESVATHDKGLDGGVMYCPTVTIPANVHFIGGQPARAGDNLSFWCGAGEILVGSSVIGCGADGTWSSLPPTCVPGCSQALTAPRLGTVSVPVIPAVGSVANYACAQGFVIAGSASRTCATGGTWTGSAPVCIQPCFAGDFDSNGRTDDHGCWNPETGFWTARHGSTVVANFQAAAPGTALVPLLGDVDSDSRTDDLVLWDPVGLYGSARRTDGSSLGLLLLSGSSSPGQVPFNADFDNDGKSDDWATWTPTTGEWHVRIGGSSVDSYAVVNGASTDIPLVADVDGNGIADLVVYRPGTPSYWWARNVNGTPVPSLNGVAFGSRTDRPLIMNNRGSNPFDKSFDDLCVFGPRAGMSFGWWNVRHLGSTTNTVTNFSMGDPTALPVVGDLDGDGQFDDLGIRESLWTNWWAYRISGSAILEDAP